MADIRRIEDQTKLELDEVRTNILGHLHWSTWFFYVTTSHMQYVFIFWACPVYIVNAGSK